MRSFIVALAFLIGAAASGHAAPCLPDTLAAYLGYGATGCSIGGSLFSDFNPEEAPTGSLPIDPGAVLVTPIATSGTVGLQFVVNTAADQGDFFDLVFSYLVSGTPIGSAELMLLDSTVADDGANTGVLGLCLGTGFTGSLCFGDAATLIAVDTALDHLLSDSTTFPPVSPVGVLMDIGVDAGPSGSASLGSVENRFGVAPVAVPEPSTLVLLGLGLTAGTLGRRRPGIR